MKKIVLASGNQGKIDELNTLLSPHSYRVIAQTSLAVVECEETGLTFFENALIKARNAVMQTGLPAIADDSGLVIAALDDKPGIYSARYSGPDATDERNIQTILTQMATVPDDQRQAFFYCALVYLKHANDPTPIFINRSWHGRILLEKQGSNGFGYDPIFYIPSLGCSAAQLTSTQKNQVSHRGLAVSALLSCLTTTTSC